GGAAHAAESPRGRARDRPRGHGGDPRRRDEVARRLRDAGRDHPPRRAAGPGSAEAGPRGPAAPRVPGPAVRGDDLLWILVLARAADPPGVNGRLPAGRERGRPREALQGRGDGRRTALAALALPDGLRHLRGGPGLPPARRRGVHQPERPPAQDPSAPRAGELSRVNLPIGLTLTRIVLVQIGRASCRERVELTAGVVTS